MFPGGVGAQLFYGSIKKVPKMAETSPEGGFWSKNALKTTQKIKSPFSVTLPRAKRATTTAAKPMAHKDHEIEATPASRSPESLLAGVGSGGSAD